MCDNLKQVRIGIYKALIQYIIVSYGITFWRSTYKSHTTE